MTVDITQEEMNILNLNGISAEDVRANVEFSRANGLDDNAIREQFSNTINELKPLTKTSVNDTGKIQAWKDKGPITPYEMGKLSTVVYNGTYNNIDNSANLTQLGQKLKNSERNNSVEQRLQAQKEKKAERDKRVNKGTASFIDRAGAAIDRMGSASYQAQVNSPDDFTAARAGISHPAEAKNGKIGFTEAYANSFMTGSWIPFVGGFISGADTKKEREIGEKIRDRKPLRQDEIDFINHRIEKRQEESVRGYTIGGDIANNFLPSLIRFGTEIASAQWVLKGLGLTSELPAGANLGQKVAHGLGEMVKTGIANTLLPTGWNDTFEYYQDRMLNNEFSLTDKGELIFQESEEKPATAFMKSLGKTFIMFASEAAGELIGIPVKGAGAAMNKYVGTPISKYLNSNKTLKQFAKKVTPELSKLYEKMNDLPVKGESVDWLKSQVKFDGFIEELGEEVLEDVLNLTIGTDNEERTLENYAKTIFKSPDEWAVLAGAIALQGGTLSVASHLLGSHLEQNGATDEEIIEVLNSLSEKGKEDAVDKLIEEGSLNIDETEEQHFEKTVNTVAESLLQSGKFKDKENADKAVRLGATMLDNLSKKTGKSFDELVQEDMAEIEEIDEEKYLDENGTLQGYVSNEPVTIQSRIDSLIDEVSSVPEDYENKEELNKKVQEIDLLTKLVNNELELEEIEAVNNMIAELEENGDTEFAQTVKDALSAEKTAENKVHFQRANLAGAEGNELIDAAKEWKEKGTDSKYFKNWFGDSKVVDESGKPLVVYHGTESDEAFSVFEPNSPDGTPAIYFSSNKKVANSYSVNLPVFEVYLKMENPLEIDAQGKEYNDFTAEMRSNIDYANRNGYDGVIVKNIRDGWSQNKGGKVATTYVTFNPEQIKSVDNQGTFDESNPNIYYQSAMKKSEFSSFDDFYNDVLANKQTKEKKQYNYLSKEGLNIRIPHDTINHEQKKHKLTSDEWNTLLENIDNVSNADISEQKSSYDGKSVLLKIKAGNKVFGVVLETFKKNNPLISTAFIDTEKNIDNWIKNEGVSSGTKTSFLNITLNNIIKDVQPNFKTKVIGKTYYQSAYHGSPHDFDEFSLDAIGTGEGNQAHGYGLYFAENKDVSDKRYRKRLSGDKVFYDGKELHHQYWNANNKSNENYDWNEQWLLEVINEIIKVKGEKQISLEEARKEFINEYSSKGKLLAFQKKKLEIAKNLDVSKIKTQKGQLFEVDIPEVDEMLDEDKTTSEQSKKVLESLKKLCREEGFNYLKVVSGLGKGMIPQTGKQIYNNLRNYIQWKAEENGNKISDVNSAKEASILLNNYGIKGITYDGRQDGRCYVVFDNKAVQVLKTYYQKQGKLFIDNERAEKITNRFTKIKGTFIPAENLIQLFKNADESTIVHEFAHWWLDKLQKYAPENEELMEDLTEIRKFLRNNGEEFTDEQHERFARGFEAYMRTGSAKTNRLKKLFEDFKNALLSLYDSIKELGFTEDEIPEINNLFERLLTTENERIQAAVFDKCNSIQSQIQSIKDNQEQEFADIEQIERDNLERNLKNNIRDKQVKEYLRLAQKAVSRVPKGVKEYQERYKKATLEILEAATGYKRQFIANPKNWEIIEQKIANLSDEITSQNGMQSNWKEFYNDTGTSYENDEIDGDYKLAEQAFKTLTSGDYSPMNMEEEEIGKFFGMFDYLEGKVLSLRGENKNAAYEALTSLFNDIPAMPDEAMQELVDKLQVVGEKFIDQKAMERPDSKAIPNVSLAVQLRTYVTSKLHNMKAYDPDSKRVIRLSQVNRLYTLLKFANSVADTKQIIRTINNHAIEQLENRQKHILHKEIQKQVRINSKLIKVGALKKGKFDWKTNTIFHELQDMNKLSLEEAQSEYQRLINADSAVLGEERENISQNPTTSLSAQTEFQSILKTKFLEYKSNRVRDLNLAATRSLLEDILELKFEGRRAKNEDELKKALSRYNYETNLVTAAYANKGNKLANYLTRWTAGDTLFTSEGTLANWESLLNHIFNKDIAQKYSLLKTEADVEVYAHKKCLEFYNKALDIYGLRTDTSTAKGKLVDMWNRTLDFDNTQPIIKLFQEYENNGHTYTFKQYTYNKDTNNFVETPIELTHSQLITLYAWSLNPELKKRIIVQFVGEPEDNNYSEFEEQLNELMFSKLSEQDKEFARAMIDICDSMYNDTNEVFIRTTGLSLPRVENYIPSKTERIGSDLDMLHETVLRSTNPSFIKQRKTCRRIKMDPVSPLEIIIPHINKTARYIVASEKVNFYNRIFQAPDVKAAILDIYGKKSGTKIYRVLLNQLATSTYENYARAITVGKSICDTIASNYITSRIGGNAKVFLSQLTSVINYAENMPAMEWAKGFKDALLKPKETIEYMMENCDYLKARIAGNSQNEIIASLTNEADKMRSWRNFCTSNTKFGDILAIAFGGKPYVDYLMKQGLSKEDAFERFIESTLRSQQSGHSSATSAWQKQQSQNAFTRMIFAFNNTNFQYERKFIDALSEFSRGHISKTDFAKSVLVYKIFNPLLFASFLSNLSILILLQNMFGGGDDDPLKAFGEDAIVSIALSNWKAYGMIGIMANAIVSAVAAKATDGKFFEDSLPLISDFENTIQKLLKGKNLETADYIEMIAGIGDYTTGVAATRLYNTAGGIGDVAQGNFGKGFLRILGYGNYRAELAATGSAQKKRKKR